MRDQDTPPIGDRLDDAIDATLREMAVAEPSSTLERSVMRRVRGEGDGTGRRSATMPRVRWQWIVAAAAVAGVSVLLLTPFISSPPRPGDVSPTEPRGRAGSGEARPQLPPQVSPAPTAGSTRPAQATPPRDQRVALRPTRPAGGRTTVTSGRAGSDLTTVDVAESSGLVIAAAALLPEGEEDEGPIPRLVVMPIPAPTPVTVPQLVVPELSIDQINVRPIEMAPLDSVGRPSTERESSGRKEP